MAHKSWNRGFEAQPRLFREKFGLGYFFLFILFLIFMFPLADLWNSILKVILSFLLLFVLQFFAQIKDESYITSEFQILSSQSPVNSQSSRLNCKCMRNTIFLFIVAIFIFTSVRSRHLSRSTLHFNRILRNDSSVRRSTLCP